VEGWFPYDFVGGPVDPAFAAVDWQSDPDWEFRTARDEPIGDLVAAYLAACERSRAAVAGRDLDERCANPEGDAWFNLRYVYVHMIEETARHLGQLDILRELLDGTTGE